MTPKDILRAANTTVSKLSILNGEYSTVVLGSPASGKNTMLLGMMMQRGIDNCTMIVTETHPANMANKIGVGALVVCGGLNLEKLIEAVSFACTQDREHIFIEHVQPMLGHDIVEILESIVKPFNKRIYIGIQAARSSGLGDNYKTQMMNTLTLG
ncbi:hypothetical protein phiST2_0019 [Vibrio phage phi-ST2]|uniref:Uncharacterized protein n=1 Tax=Vibrio phage VH7D TaxID=1262539 RepID=V9LYR1_9CAUD|nr:hypothetical protein CF80_gp037 [Vibrio phage VH7D]ALP47507.1 hypothetical protein phiST2_0019 [Vibrio phage phi-ST2]QBX06322.1 hypothetical protein Va3_369 [Vibrio phage Va3]QNJ54565.1 hypothetical protein vBValMR10Z_24 [Vibrio phage vB_ValM_R10Z]QNJ54950.1 hypothetical protein vBValMR11Z_24 [Vibrio phage vB_ValM_R11Z]URQ03733.1 hypothetical protein PVA23_356 [Vibrio phage PVA23]